MTNAAIQVPTPAESLVSRDEFVSSHDETASSSADTNENLNPNPTGEEEEDEFFDAYEQDPEQVERLLAEATERKNAGNLHFATGRYEEAIKEYEEALGVCPEVKAEERAVYWGNIGACYMKMEDYKKAVEACTESLSLSPRYTKSLLRRAQANEKINTHSALSDALEDYRALRDIEDVNDYTKQESNKAERRLPPLIKERMEKEREEMLGKLKDLGNSLLGRFGLSTDNFQMKQDPESGSYSMNFVNSPKK